VKKIVKVSIPRLAQFKGVQSSFQYFVRRRFRSVIFTTLYQLMLQSWYQKAAQSPVNTLVLFSWRNRIPWQHYELLKTPLISTLSTYISKTVGWIFFYISNSDKQDKMQLLAKFKKKLYIRFRATLNLRNFQVALNSMYRIFLNFVKSCILSSLLKFDIKKKFTVLVLKYKRWKLKLKVFLACQSVAMVTYCVTKMIPVIAHFFDTMTVASIDKEW